MKLGEKQVLMMEKEVDFGVYLGTESEHVSYRKSRCQGGWSPEIGGSILYKIPGTADRDNQRTEAHSWRTSNTGSHRHRKNGAFLDWGLEKDLFLPFREQTTPVKKGDSILVSLYIDKSARLCATMKVYEKLSCDSPYQKDDRVQGIIYDTSEEFGVFVAVDNCYSARIPKKDVIGTMKVGDVVEARVTAVKEDGKLDLSVRRKIPEQMEATPNISCRVSDGAAEACRLRTNPIRNRSNGNWA